MPTNRLAHETSPYLLQHAHNPVDWYPWGPEAIERARELDRPIFLSVGYSACHWCHVMERESFEDAGLAQLLNEHFVSIKVDREERPDVDELYMKAVQAMTGAGGWPMSVFLTPDLEPFFGGTYSPPTQRWGRPGFREILLQLSATWNESRARLLDHGERMAERIRQEALADHRGPIAPDLLEEALGALGDAYDPDWGGFGGPPKFLHAMDIRVCLREHRRTGSTRALEMATHTLDRMAQGGLWDHLAGGFHRYSTDEKWLIPHFEKMLYDNALLVPAYLEAFQVTGEAEYARIARETCAWMIGEMRTSAGAFASTIDADTDGEEGRFYVWTPQELQDTLGPRRGAWMAAWWGVTDEGNFEDGASALWRQEPEEDVAEALGVDLTLLRDCAREARKELLAARSRRTRPALDDKVLTAWNGLAISALSATARVLDDEGCLKAAQGAAAHLLATMRTPNGRLFSTARGDVRKHDGCLDDYAFLIQGLLDLFESDFDPAWLEAALGLNQVLLEDFEDTATGGFFTTGKDHERLLARLKTSQDGALPSGNSVQALNLLRLADLTARPELAEAASRTLEAFARLANRYPVAFGQYLLALDVLRQGPQEVVITGGLDDPGTRELLSALRGTFAPGISVALADGRTPASLAPVLEGKEGGRAPRAFVCRNYACEAPVETVEELLAALRAH